MQNQEWPRFIGKAEFSASARHPQTATVLKEDGMFYGSSLSESLAISIPISLLGAPVAIASRNTEHLFIMANALRTQFVESISHIRPRTSFLFSRGAAVIHGIIRPKNQNAARPKIVVEFGRALC
jgi:hypothetical protein